MEIEQMQDVQTQTGGPEAGLPIPEETKRDRVRRLFIDRLSQDGMRFKHGTPEFEQKKRLDRMADDLSYMSDNNLEKLRLCLRTKGEGTSKNFWPSRVTVLGFAEVAQPRPLEEIPGLKGWFVSDAGRQAAKVPGQLLAEFRFWTQFKRPPMTAGEKAKIGRDAKEIGSRMSRLKERQERDVPLTDEDRYWLEHAQTAKAKIEGWMREGRSG
jgi:hypothetical protein